MEEDDINTQQGGGGAAGVHILFKSRGAGGDDLRIGDLGGHPPHGKCPGGVSGPYGKTADEVAPAAETGREVDVHLGGKGKGGGRVTEYGGIHPAALEHGRIVHRYAITVRPV